MNFIAMQVLRQNFRAASVNMIRKDYYANCDAKKTTKVHHIILLLPVVKVKPSFCPSTTVEVNRNTNILF